MSSDAHHGSNAPPTWSGAAALRTLGFEGASVQLTLDDSEAGAPAPLEDAWSTSNRFQSLSLLGRGGMGEVWRVRDNDLNRVVAMKIMDVRLNEGADLARFVAEAQATAQLEHPGIVPVHEFGLLEDGRLYYTMKEVRGRTLKAVISETHTGGPEAWSLRRLIGAFHRVCEAVAYAHSRGVIHRDLKPENVMIGAFGEALVLDWGLAKVLGRSEILTGQPGASDEDLDVTTVHSVSETGATRQGVVIGTPLYMPPEQARGLHDTLGPPADVYALGAILYRILTDRAPVSGSSANEVLAKVMYGALDPLDVPAPPLLREACERALSPRPEDRQPDAGALAAEIRAWLEGAKAREAALAVVAEADGIPPEISALRAQVTRLRAEAEALLDPIGTWEPEERKLPGWSRLEEAERLEQQAELLELRYVQLLHSALNHAPELPEAHARLARHYRDRHAEAERREDAHGSRRFELLLRSHARGDAHAAYLRGEGSLTLVTDPPGAEVRLHRYVPHRRRLVPSFERVLGHTPLQDVALPIGSYLLTLHAEGREAVRYPISLRRGQRWDGVRPGDSDPTPIRLPRPGEVPAGFELVPPGWFISGGDPGSDSALDRRRLWADGFLCARTPVTNRQYLRFLNDLVAQGREEEALLWVPRSREAANNDGPMCYGRDERGMFRLVPDAEGDLWDLDWAVFCIEQGGAWAYCRWLEEADGRAWRLPSEWEREKAARGVDGRYYPWGDHFDGSWSCTYECHADRPLPPKVGTFPIDVSPFGVHDMAGGVRDWCAEVFDKRGPDAGGVVQTPARPSLDALRELKRSRALVMVASRGGQWSAFSSFGRCAYRISGGTFVRSIHQGFRPALCYR